MSSIADAASDSASASAVGIHPQSNGVCGGLLEKGEDEDYLQDISAIVRSEML